MKRQKWTTEEDACLKELVSKEEEEVRWELMTLKMRQAGFHKTTKQIKTRWTNNLSPNINKKKWSENESYKLFKSYQKHGNYWKAIAKEFNGRTDNCVKNHFFSIIRKALRLALKCLEDSTKDSGTKIINKIKPKILSDFLKEEVDVANEKGIYIEVVDFIKKYAFKDKKMDNQRGSMSERDVVKRFIDHLREMNNKYVERKKSLNKFKEMAKEEQLNDKQMDPIKIKVVTHTNTSRKDSKQSIKQVSPHNNDGFQYLKPVIDENKNVENLKQNLNLISELAIKARNLDFTGYGYNQDLESNLENLLGQISGLLNKAKNQTNKIINKPFNFNPTDSLVSEQISILHPNPFRKYTNNFNIASIFNEKEIDKAPSNPSIMNTQRNKEFNLIGFKRGPSDVSFNFKPLESVKQSEDYMASFYNSSKRASPNKPFLENINQFFNGDGMFPDDEEIIKNNNIERQTYMNYKKCKTDETPARGPG